MGRDQRRGRGTGVPGGEGGGLGLRGGSRVPGREKGRPRWGRAGPGEGVRACGGWTTGSPREGWGATHMHWQLLVAPGARATPTGAAQPTARGATATASVRHVGSQSRGPPRPRPRARRASAGSALGARPGDARGRGPVRASVASL